MLADIVFSLYTTIFPQFANSNTQQDLSNQGTHVYCGTIEEIFNNRPRFISDDAVLSFEYRSRAKRLFLIELYKKGQYSANSDTKNPIKFMDNGDFDAFVVYELDGNEIPRKHPTASGYFKGQLLLVLYDFFTGRGNRLTTPIPDGYVEDAKCFVTAEKPVSWLILDIVEEIANKRLPQPKK